MYFSEKKRRILARLQGIQMSLGNRFTSGLAKLDSKLREEYKKSLSLRKFSGFKNQEFLS